MMNLDEVLIIAASIIALSLSLQLGYPMLEENMTYKSEILYLVNATVLSLAPGSSLEISLPYPVAFNNSDLEKNQVPALGQIGGSCLKISKNLKGIAKVSVCEP